METHIYNPSTILKEAVMKTIFRLKLKGGQSIHCYFQFRNWRIGFETFSPIGAYTIHLLFIKIDLDWFKERNFTRAMQWIDVVNINFIVEIGRKDIHQPTKRRTHYQISTEPCSYMIGAYFGTGWQCINLPLLTAIRSTEIPRPVH